MSDPILNEERSKAHYAWRGAINEVLPALAVRVFGLRNAGYMGCGFHYGIEQRLGRVMAVCNDYDNPLTLARSSVERVAWKMLNRDVELAENTAVFDPDHTTEEMKARFLLVEARYKAAGLLTGQGFVLTWNKHSRRQPHSGRVETWLAVFLRHDLLERAEMLNLAEITSGDGFGIKMMEAGETLCVTAKEDA